MNKQIEALKTTIDAIEYQESLDPDKSSTTEWNHSWKELSKALILCKEALAEAESESNSQPVAFNGKDYMEGFNAGKMFAELESQEQEPDYWLGYGLQAYTEKPYDDATPLYTHPAPALKEKNHG